MTHLSHRPRPPWIALLGTFVVLVGATTYLVVSRSDSFLAPVAGVSGAADITESQPFPQDYPRQTRRAPELNLKDQDGRLVRVSDFAGRPVIVSFAFGHCASMCPLLIRSIKQLRDQLDKDGTVGLDAAPAVVLVTLDPEHDTPAMLPSIAKDWGLDAASNMHYLSGDPQSVEATLDAWEVSRTRNPDTGEIVHPGLVYIVDPKGNVTYALTNPSVAWLAEATQRVLL